MFVSKQGARYGAIALIFGIAFTLTGSPPSVHAEDETENLAMIPIKPRRAGFRGAFSMPHSGGNGYQPVHVRFMPQGKAFAATRYITVQIRPRSDRGTDLDLQYSRDVELPQGASKAEAILYVPHYYRWERVTIRLLEDGREVDTGEGNFSVINSCKAGGQRTTFGILQPSDEKLAKEEWKRCPDVRALVTVFGNGPLPEDTSTKRLNNLQSRSYVDRQRPGYAQFRRINETELYDTWLGYSQLDVLMTPLPLLQRIEQTQPEQARAIQDWVSTGGNLWVYGCSGGEPMTEWLDGLTDVAPTTSNMVYQPKSVPRTLNLSGNNSTEVLQYNAWQGWYSNTVYYSGNSGGESRQRIYDRLVKDENPVIATVPVDEVAGQIRSGTFGLGRVMLMEPVDPFPGTFQFWQTVAKINTPDQVNWGKRHGLDVMKGHGNYWKWLIGAVGQPPVKSFVALNTVFVILIGPFLYSFLRRRDRLYLLYFFGPALAIFVTCSLFFYAVVADGISTRARARRVSWVDLKDDYVVSQMHHTYYTVLGAGNGLEFDKDEAVYPFRHSDIVDGYYYRSADGSIPGEGTVSVDDQTQRLDGVFLPSRDQVQFVTIKPEHKAKTVDFDVTANEVLLTSHLQQKILDVLVKDNRGVLWRASDIDAEKSVKLEMQSQLEIESVLDDRVFPDEAEVPELQRMSRNSWVTGNSYGPMIDSTALETRLQRWKQNMPNGTFVIIAELDENDLAIGDVRLSQSAHVLMGELP